MRNLANSPFHVRQKYAWNAHAFQLGYIFAMGNAPFPYISGIPRSNRPTLGRAAYRMSQYNECQHNVQSFPHLMQVVASSENDRTRNYSPSKTSIFDS